MKEITLQLTDEQYQRVKKLADLQHILVTEFMEQLVLARVQADIDYQDAVANLRASHGETVSRADILRRLETES